MKAAQWHEVKMARLSSNINTRIFRVVAAIERLHKRLQPTEPSDMKSQLWYFWKVLFVRKVDFWFIPILSSTEALG